MTTLPTRVTLVDVGPRDGKVAELLFAIGDQVTDGANC